jgi:hypothetical protein
MTELRFRQGFSRNLPTIENAIAIFDNWVSALPIPGTPGGNAQMFLPEQDPRPSYVCDIFGSLEQFKVLELGSLEGGHSYQLEKLGAKAITGIEANAESFLKSLIIKEALGLKAKLLYGDFIKYLETVEIRYDLIFACGVLYHMTDPLHLLHLISRRTDRVFIWTHYVSIEDTRNSTECFDVSHEGFSCRYYKYFYDPNHDTRRYSGLESYSCHLLKADILRALNHFEFGKIHVMKDDARGPGSSLSIVAYR